MSDEGVDLGRRHFLTVATTVTGVGGAVLAAVPFVASMQPSAKAKALGAPVEVDTSKLEPGQEVVTKWRGRAVGVIRRTEAMLESLEEVAGRLRDPDSKEPQQPDYAQNPHRSIKPGILVVEKRCTHLGCSPTYRPDVAAEDLGDDWLGGFYCACHGSRFDLAGRVYKGVPAPLNLEIPPHRYLDSSVIQIGDPTGAA